MPQIQLTDDELTAVVGSAQGLPAIVEQVREWLTQGHRAARG